jgi:hypothetical protein
LHKCFFVVIVMFLAPELRAQDGAASSTSRTDQIREERLAKSRSLPPEPSTAAKSFSRIAKSLDRIPVRIGMGGLGPGAGLSAGTIFHWNSSGDEVRSRLWGTASIRRFYAVGTALEVPHIGGDHVSFVLEASHKDAPQLEYYGSGPDSSIQNRTNFRREDTLFESRVEVRPHRHLTSICRLGQLLLNVGPGTDESLASSELVFRPDEAPGIDVQSDFLIAGCATQFDLRDVPGDAHEGMYVTAGYERYFAEDEDRFSFHRFSAGVEQYIPFFNQTRVIAVRAKTELSLHSGDQAVPFFLQSTLGSDHDLRGFRRFRFYDENSIVLNAEYRWEVSTRFDMALFVDAGKVFHRPGEISLSEMESSAGFGLRFKNSRSVAVRLDTGFSREGVHVWLKFGKPF